MTTIKISKQKIINALKKEPLKAGLWINDLGPRESCAVCAVGAVCRNIINDKARIDTLADFITDAKNNSVTPHHNVKNDGFYSVMTLQQLLNKKAYMAALSMFFETEWTRYSYPEKSVSRIRAKTIQFVKDNFPKELTLDINGFEPARDVQVVG